MERDDAPVAKLERLELTVLLERALIRREGAEESLDFGGMTLIHAILKGHKGYGYSVT